MALIQNCLIPRICPHVVAEASEFLPDLLITPCIVNHCLHLARRTDHALNIQNALHISIVIGRNFIVIKVVKALPEDFSLLKHQIPAKATLQTFQCQMLEHMPVIMHWNSPFSIMVCSVSLIHTGPGTVAHFTLSSRYFTVFPVF